MYCDITLDITCQKPEVGCGSSQSTGGTFYNCTEFKQYQLGTTCLFFCNEGKRDELKLFEQCIIDHIVKFFSIAFIYCRYL